MSQCLVTNIARHGCQTRLPSPVVLIVQRSCATWCRSRMFDLITDVRSRGRCTVTFRGPGFQEVTIGLTPASLKQAPMHCLISCLFFLLVCKACQQLQGLPWIRSNDAMLVQLIPCPGQGDRLGRPVPGISCFANIYHNYSCRLQVSCTPRLPLHSSLLTHIHTSAGQNYAHVSTAALANPIRCSVIQTHSSRRAGLEASSSSTVQSGPQIPGNGSSPNGRNPMGSGDNDFAVNFGGKQLTKRSRRFNLRCYAV
jgi:hypothetical protein